MHIYSSHETLVIAKGKYQGLFHAFLTRLANFRLLLLVTSVKITTTRSESKCENSLLNKNCFLSNILWLNHMFIEEKIKVFEMQGQQKVARDGNKKEK